VSKESISCFQDAAGAIENPVFPWVYLGEAKIVPMFLCPGQTGLH
jgi:hypothetical protein